MLRFQLFVLSVLQILDVLTTQRGLELGGAEMNPVAKILLEIPGGFVLGKSISMLITIAISWYIYKEYPESRTALGNILMLIIGGTAAVVILNALNIMIWSGRL